MFSGKSTLTRSDTKGHAKLVDITGCTLALDPDDIESVSDRLLQYGTGERLGPVAMVVGSALAEAVCRRSH